MEEEVRRQETRQGCVRCKVDGRCGRVADVQVGMHEPRREQRWHKVERT